MDDKDGGKDDRMKRGDKVVPLVFEKEESFRCILPL